MKLRLITLLLLIGFTCATVAAQESAPAPFALLDKQVKKQKLGWEGFKQTLATLFNAERKRLGNSFETELLKYIDQDVEKHYWVSLFLTEPGYLHGNRPLPQLSLYIKHQALSFLQGKVDEASLGQALRLSVSAAVLSKRMGLNALAAAYKSQAERLMAMKRSPRERFPALDEEERKVYDSILWSNGRGAPAFIKQ